MIILTHILEHIYDPVEVLEKCDEILRPNGRLLIEVPALVEPAYWPPGYFTLEHLNYFSPQSMKILLSLSGFEPEDEIVVHLEGDQYPVMTCIVCRNAVETKGHSIVSDYDDALQTCNPYLELEAKEWRRIDSLLRVALQGFERVAIWGAGIHTSQLLARTNIASYVSIDCIVDTDSQKWGMMLGEYPVIAPEQVQFADQSMALVISSHASEREIYQVVADRPDLKCQVIKLYE